MNLQNWYFWARALNFVKLRPTVIAHSFYGNLTKRAFPWKSFDEVKTP